MKSRQAPSSKDRAAPSDPMSDRIEYCFRVAGGVRAVSKATDLVESLLYRYRKPGASRRTDVLSLIAKAANVSEAWLLTGIETDPSKSTSARPKYHSLADLPYRMSAEYEMDAAARRELIFEREGGAEFKDATLRALEEELHRLKGRIEVLESQLAASRPRGGKKAARA